MRTNIMSLIAHNFYIWRRTTYDNNSFMIGRIGGYVNIAYYEGVINYDRYIRLENIIDKIRNGKYKIRET